MRAGRRVSKTNGRYPYTCALKREGLEHKEGTDLPKRFLCQLLSDPRRPKISRVGRGDVGVAGRAGRRR
jgi:hypothetical protein